MNLLLLTLALATTVQAAPVPASAAQQAYDASVACASANMVASIVVGQMGDTAQQADLRKTADNFQLASIGFGEGLGVARPTVIETIAEASAARIAPLEAMAAAEDRATQLAAWAEDLNRQIAVCDEFAAKLAAAD